MRIGRTVSGLCVTASMLALSSLAPNAASAGGFELSGAGTRPLGRGGAFAARADDGLALLYNPAMLADQTESQITLNAGLSIWDACVARSGTYQDAIGGPGAAPAGDTIFNRAGTPDSWLASQFPTVCNSGSPQILPQIVGSVHISDEFTLAFGILTPNGVGGSQWGAADGTVAGPDGGRLPSPTRYALTDASLLLFHPSIGFGWRPLPWLRIGATFQWGIGIIDFTNYTNTGAQFEDPHDDVRTHLSVVDPFIPAGILSIHIVPHESFDIMLGARLSDAVGGAADASGSLTLTSGAYGTGMGAGTLVPTTSTVNGARLQSGQPWSFTAGFRYGHRLRPRAYTRPGDAHLRPGPDDPMADEVFDIELDFVYELNNLVGDFALTTPAGSSITIQNSGGGATSVPIPTPLPIPHGWRDNVVLRLGGDYNVIPGVFAIRAGVSYDQPIDNTYYRYVINDFIQGYRVGLHIGATVRIDNHLDISVAYAHYFAETIDNRADPSFRLIAATGAQGVCPGTTGAYDHSVVSTGCYPNGFGNAVNGAVYTQQFNIVSLSGTYHFD